MRYTIQIPREPAGNLFSADDYHLDPVLLRLSPRFQSSEDVA